MEKPNNQRILVKILSEIASESQFKIDFFCYKWIVKLTKGDMVGYIFGYDWELNNSTAQLIAKDKNACYELLKNNGIPCIEHRLFLNPLFQGYINGVGNWKHMMDYADAQAYKLVCKSNTGTGGNDVFLIENQTSLEICVHNLFTKNRAISLSPYYDISNEYRVVVLNGRVELIYLKQKPHIIGDGLKTVIELIHGKYPNYMDLELNKFDAIKILGDDEYLELSWKHNLGKGANAIILPEGQKAFELSSLAIRAAKAINICFAAVDIAEITQGLLVMEINSGVMMETFGQHGDVEYSIAKKIYKRAAEIMLC